MYYMHKAEHTLCQYAVFVYIKKYLVIIIIMLVDC